MSQTHTSARVLPSAPSALLGTAQNAWQKVLARDASASFVYAVETTGIVCRPSCPSRRPARKNVRFFSSVAEALHHGYRCCLRCHPEAIHPDAVKVEKLCAYLRKHQDRKVTLQELGKLARLSSFATQRLFQRVMGITPLRFQQGLRNSELRNDLADKRPQTQTITDAIYNAGYGASSRVYEKTDRTLGMKPGHFRNGGMGESIAFTVAACPGPGSLGYLLVAQTKRGLCHIALGDDPLSLENDLRQRFPNAEIGSTPKQELDHASPDLQQALARILSLLTQHPASLDLPLDLRATAFQQRVWQALRAIPRGQTRSYLQIANEIGQPSASRAVARACASNSLALVIPCHRVIGTSGDLRGYRWGKDRKRMLLSLEASSGS